MTEKFGLIKLPPPLVMWREKRGVAMRKRTKWIRVPNARGVCLVTRQRAICEEFSIPDYIVINKGNMQVPKLHVTEVDVGSTHFLIWANTDRKRRIKRVGGRGEYSDGKESGWETRGYVLHSKREGLLVYNSANC